MKLDTNTLIFLMGLLGASLLVLFFGQEQRVEAWVTVIVAVLTGGGGAMLPQLLQRRASSRKTSAPAPEATAEAPEPNGSDQS